MARLDYEALRKQLRILDLDIDLLSNADLSYQVYEQHMEAIAVRDALQLDLEEAEAKKAVELRKRDAADEDAKKKLTDKAIEQALRIDKGLLKLRDELLDAKKEVDRWRALEKTYDKRSDALRELVKWRIAQMNNLLSEIGGKAGRNSMAEANYKTVNAMRREKKLEGARRDGGH